MKEGDPVNLREVVIIRQRAKIQMLKEHLQHEEDKLAQLLNMHPPIIEGKRTDWDEYLKTQASSPTISSTPRFWDDWPIL